jgi:hypothetical protein
VYAAPERGWICYSCRRGGSIYDLAAELWGVGTRGGEFIELRRRLLEAFAIEVGRLERPTWIAGSVASRTCCRSRAEAPLAPRHGDEDMSRGHVACRGGRTASR